MFQISRNDRRDRDVRARYSSEATAEEKYRYFYDQASAPARLDFIDKD